MRLITTRTNDRLAKDTKAGRFASAVSARVVEVPFVMSCGFLAGGVGSGQIKNLDELRPEASFA